MREHCLQEGPEVASISVILIRSLSVSPAKGSQPSPVKVYLEVERFGV